jgi:ribosomal protein L11 methyltransferase
MGVIYKIELLVAQAQVQLIGDALDEIADAIAAFEVTPGGKWRIEAYCTEPPAPELVAAALPGLAHSIILLPTSGWLERNRQDFPAIRVARFYVYGSHLPRPPADGRIALQVEAATAFGSGEHATTRGCLSLIASAVARRKPRKALDVGCGSGILAMAIARLTRIPVTAVDIDDEAVRVTRENTRINGVRGQVRVSRSDGFHSDVIAKHEKYDLIVANILAGPLCKMAPDFRRHLAAGGRLILSGLLNEQETRVIAACRNQRLALRRRWRSDGWSALEFGYAD